MFVHSFAGFSVNDQDAAKKFYTETLGLKLTDDSMGLHFELPGGGEIFIYGKPDHQPASYTCLNFVTQDIDASVKDLRAKGVSFEHYEGMTGDDSIARSSAEQPGPSIAWFKDPADNILSVIQA